MNRRSFFRQSSALLAAIPVGSLLPSAWAVTPKPLGIGMFAVEDEWNQDPKGTLSALAKMGYQAVEFWAPYLNWTTAQAKDMRKTLDDLGLHCYSTHNDGASFTVEGLPKAIDHNHILGSKYLVISGNNMGDVGGGVSAGKVQGGLEGWRKVTDKLITFSKQLKPAGLSVGYHNHPAEFEIVEGQHPMDFIAANTPKEVMLQLCVGACVGSHADPVTFIKANPGRIRHIHCKDWNPEKKYEALFGEGASPWPQVFAASESVGGIEFYLIEQLGGRTLRTLATARQNITNWKQLKG